MTQLSNLGVSIPDILLPQGVDTAKWACIACDQYTSQPEVWQETERIVGEASPPFTHECGNTLPPSSRAPYTGSSSLRGPHSRAAARA